MVSGQPRSYPRVSNTVWFRLRDEFRRSMPRTVDVAYLVAKFGYTARSAANLPPALRALGLLDESGRPTPLASLWRDDESYKEACRQVLERAYPDVLDAFPPPNPDRAQLQRWFAQTTGAGESAASQMTTFYIMLAMGEIEERPTRSEKGDKSQKSARSNGSKAKSESQQNRTGADEPKNGYQLDPVKQVEPPLPTLHIDLQVHLAADAPEAQIESIFRNMAKYIYGRSVDE